MSVAINAFKLVDSSLLYVVVTVDVGPIRNEEIKFYMRETFVRF